MGFLKTNYDDMGGFGVLPIGDYECYVTEAKVTETSTKKPMLKVTLTVREDVEQEGKKRKFFDNVVEQENMMWKFQQVSKAAGIPAGTDIESLAHFAELIQFRPVCIRNQHREYNGEQQDSVKYWTESKVGGTGAGAGMNDPFAGGGTINIGDDDLPF